MKYLRTIHPRICCPRPSAGAGQTILEYALLLGIVVAVISAMSVFVRRSTQAMVKLVADQLGNQVNADQDKSVTFGHLESASADVKFGRSETREFGPGTVTYRYENDTVRTISSQSINQGFTHDPTR